MAQLALQRRRFSDLTDDDFRWVLQQIDARQRLASKLPSLVSEPDFWWPVRLSCEQCSSELTARYKAALISSTEHRAPITDYRLTDLTGGLGIDTLYLSRHFDHTDYVERDPELCRLARHNFALPAFASRNITVHNTTAEDYINNRLLNEKCQLSNGFSRSFEASAEIRNLEILKF